MSSKPFDAKKASKPPARAPGTITYLRTRSRSDRRKAARALDRERRAEQRVPPVELYRRVEETLQAMTRVRSARNLSKLLPILFQLNGKPYSLNDYPMFEPLFATEVPRTITLITARQVAKSTNQAAQSLLMSLLIPGLHTLFITPLFEQIRKFSANYVHDLMISSPVSGLLLARGAKNVLQRSLPNGATLFFSFAMRDADRTRGVPVDKLVLDESIRLDTPVSTPNGDRKIQSFVPGDLVHAFDEFGNLQVDRVVACEDHGVRDCYRFDLSDGSAVELTSDSFIATTAGWRRVSTLIEELAAALDSGGSQSATGRRGHGDTACLLSGQVPDIIRVRRQATQKNEELQLRQTVRRLEQSSLSEVADYRIFVAPRQSGKLGSAEIVRVTWTGRHPVFDIETEKYHTFFAGGVAVHNCQGIDPSVIPILGSTMTGSRIGPLEQRTGTPKTYDNTAHRLLAGSSWAEWVVKCDVCKYSNIPSVEFDLEKMLGPMVPTHPASKDSPGLCCAKCGRPICPRNAAWVHRYEQKRTFDAGYHFGQPTLPLHCEDEERWLLLQAKRAGDFGFNRASFLNEICGEACDSADKLLTQTDLRKAAILGANDLQTAAQNLDRYVLRVLGVDWGGGGVNRQREIKSYTALAVVGLLPDGKLEIIYGWRCNSPHDHNLEVQEITRVVSAFRIHAIAHDYTGAGAIRETLLTNVGVPLDRLLPIAYVPFASGPLMRHVPYNEVSGQRAHYRLDKARGLTLMAELIRRGDIRYFAYDYESQSRPGLLHDWLSLVEDKIDRRYSNDAYTIIHDAVKGPDDFAQASTVGAFGVFQLSGHTPSPRIQFRVPSTDEINMLGIDEDTIHRLIDESDLPPIPDRTAINSGVVQILDTL